MSAAPHRPLGQYGCDLLPHHIELIKARWITPELAKEAGLRSVDEYDGREITGRRQGDLSGIAFPYRDPATGHLRATRLRVDNPGFELDPANKTVKPKFRYLSASGSRSIPYYTPGISEQHLRDVTLPILLTEGELKALAAHRAARHNSQNLRFIAIGLNGVFGWRSTVGIETTANGSRESVQGVAIDFDRILWADRRVFIAFDSDKVNKPQVSAAEAGLRKELQRRGASVSILNWDQTKGKGCDDFLAENGPEAFFKLIDESTSAEGGWKSTLIKSDKSGAPRALLANCCMALRHAPEWQGVLAYDEFALRVAIRRRPTPWGAGTAAPWTDSQDRLTAEWLQVHGIHVGVEVAAQAVQTVAEEHSFHPVREWLKILRWDGNERLSTWLRDYLGVEDSDYSRAVARRWPLAAVARIFSPGIKADCCLILEGAQGIGKSRALKILGGKWFTDDIADLGSKDAAMQLQGVWVVELAELDSMSRADVGRVKAVMSRPTDRFRPPYGKRLIESPRQCVFAGTVNHNAYLRDETGGRRFWPVACTQIDLDQLQQNRDQLWAEAVVAYNAGEPWWLDTQSLVGVAAAEQLDRFEVDAWQTAIDAWTQGQNEITIHQVLTSCLGKSVDKIQQTDQNRVARCLRAMKWVRFNARTGTTASGREWRYRRTE